MFITKVSLKCNIYCSFYRINTLLDYFFTNLIFVIGDCVKWPKFVFCSWLLLWNQFFRFCVSPLYLLVGPEEYLCASWRVRHSGKKPLELITYHINWHCLKVLGKQIEGFSTVLINVTVQLYKWIMLEYVDSASYALCLDCTLSKSNVGYCFRVSKLVTFPFIFYSFKMNVSLVLFTCAMDVCWHFTCII